MDKQDYYETLGVGKDASQKEIKKAYRKRAKEFHPDHNKTENAEVKFKEISDAYDVLSDESKRQAYDQFGHAGTQGYGPYSNGGAGGYSGDPFDMGDLGDIFSTFFGGGQAGFGFDFGGGMGSQGGSINKQGSDLRYKIRLEFMESIDGGEYEIRVDKDISCEACKGTGSKSGKQKTCSKCNGRGKVQQVRQSFLGQMAVMAECPDCNGKGEVIEDPCEECGGDGLKQEKVGIKINIPKGAYDGMVLRFTGSGNAGERGGNTGDLYIEITVEPHDLFERRGNDIYTDVDIDPVTAVLGTNLTVKTIYGESKIKIPAGTQPDTIFKISGKGAPVVGKEDTGDQYVRVKIAIPKRVSRKEKKIWQQLQK